MPHRVKSTQLLSLLLIFAEIEWSHKEHCSNTMDYQQCIILCQLCIHSLKTDPIIFLCIIMRCYCYAEKTVYAIFSQNIVLNPLRIGKWYFFQCLKEAKAWIMFHSDWKSSVALVFLSPILQIESSGVIYFFSWWHPWCS